VQIVALIPARGGSKGIPEKNLAPLAGRPLIAWTLEAARGSRLVTRVVVSTDSPEIAAEARAHQAEVLDRPAELAADDTPMLPVIRHALAELGPVDVLVVLQPTSPLRRPDHIDQALDVLLEDERRDTVVSVVEVPHNLRPGKLLAVDGGRLIPLGSDPLHRETPPVYARNGPAVLALRPDRLGDDLYGGDVRPYVMSALDSIDVDGPDDLRLAELLLVSLGAR
jgi:CMP-N,N'-diacetyllegionaminic acid synthase